MWLFSKNKPKEEEEEEQQYSDDERERISEFIPGKATPSSYKSKETMRNETPVSYSVKYCLLFNMKNNFFCTTTICVP